MTNEQLDILEAAAKGATPGPWITVKDDFDEDKNLITTEQRYEASPQIVEIAILETGWNEPMEREQQANLAYIAAANPAAVLDLIAELRQVRRERDWLASQLEGACYSAEDAEYCSLHDCNDCKYTSAKVWLEAAKEAVK